MLWKFYFNLISASLLCTLHFPSFFSSLLVGNARKKVSVSFKMENTTRERASLERRRRRRRRKKEKGEKREREKSASARERERERERAERARERECESERESSIVCVVRFGTVVGRERVSVLALRLALE